MMLLKRFGYAWIFGLMILISCSKDDDSPATPTPTPAPPSSSGIGTPTGTYTRKVLLEYHTAAWCGTCPDAFSKRDQVMNAFPGKVIPVEIHQSDGMQIPLFMTIDATFGSNPASGMVNRVPSLGTVLLNRTQWMSNVTVQAGAATKCGLAINSTINGNSLAVEVQAAYKEALSGSYAITVYLTAMNVSGTGSQYDQVNSYNNDPSSSYYHLGNPITGFKHQYVVKKVLTANMGDAIAASELIAGGLTKKNFTADITGMDAAELYLVAFVTKNGTSATTYEVLNVQRAKADVLQNWN
ncbi:MAG: Omp28-related outer membrane protein [Bacteroidia bacterium]|nr:Omp28-related outer membrane protein [Bacteroidota bacterium]MBP9083504.1 Omp28-related outer membrane protein [Bacteroidia bacterium]